MEYEELKQQYLDLRRKNCELHDRRIKRGEPIGGKGYKRTEEEEKNRHQIDMTKDRILACPESFDLVRCWMVDVCGKDGPSKMDKDEAKKIVRDYVSGHAATDRAGGLAQAVRVFLEKEGFNVTDSGMGCGGWHLGSHCTEAEARKLCTLARERFAKAFERGLLYMRRMSWSLGFLKE